MSRSGRLPERLGLVPETAGSNIPFCKEKRRASWSNTFITFCLRDDIWTFKSSRTDKQIWRQIIALGSGHILEVFAAKSGLLYDFFTHMVIGNGFTTDSCSFAHLILHAVASSPLWSQEVAFSSPIWYSTLWLLHLYGHRKWGFLRPSDIPRCGFFISMVIGNGFFFAHLILHAVASSPLWSQEVAFSSPIWYSTQWLLHLYGHRKWGFLRPSDTPLCGFFISMVIENGGFFAHLIFHAVASSSLWS